MKTESKGLRAGYVAQLVTPEVRPVIFQIEHGASFEFGAHWVWADGAVSYTDAGLILIADELEARELKAAALVIRKEIATRAEMARLAETFRGAEPSIKTSGASDPLSKRWDRQQEMKEAS